MTLSQLLREHRITASVEWADENPHMTDMPVGSYHYRVTLRCGRRQMTVPFSMGPALCHEPTADDVLECLLSDASFAEESFQDFCSNLGYDTDSRTAERIYKGTRRQTDKLKRLLGAQYETFLYAEH